MDTNQITPDVTLDVSGLMCPMPGVKATQAVRKLQPGQTLEVKSSNPIFKKFGPMITKRFGSEILGMTEDNDGFFRIYLKKS